MTDQTISPILTRLADIVADLNQALDIARGQGVRHRLAVVKTLGSDPPHYQVALIDPAAAPPPAEEPPPPARMTAGTVDAPPLASEPDTTGYYHDVGDDAVDVMDFCGVSEVAGHEFCGLSHEYDAPRLTDELAAGRNFVGWCHELETALDKARDLRDAFGEAGVIPAAPEGGTP